MEELMEKLKKFEFLTPLLVLLNLFVTTLFAGDLIKSIIEKVFQCIIEKIDAGILTILFTYILNFICILLIIALSNKIFNVEKKKNVSVRKKIIFHKGSRFNSKTNICVRKKNMTIKTNIPLKDNVTLEDLNTKYSKYLKRTIIITLIFFFLCKILLTWTKSEANIEYKISFIILQIFTMIIVIHCIYYKDLSEINSISSLFFMNSNKRGKFYYYLWNMILIYLLVILCYLVTIEMGAYGIDGMKDFINWIITDLFRIDLN